VALELVNTSPGKDTRILKPGGPYHFGLATDSIPVALGTARVYLGSSDLRNHGELPEADARISQFGIVGLYATERRQPVGPPIAISMSGNDLVMSRASGDQGDAGIYEVTVPVAREASVMAYAKVRRATWTPANPDWCSATNMVAPYFGIRYGQYNAGAFVFLRDNGTGEAVVTGPLQALSAPRQIQEELPFAWKALTSGQTIEFWIYINHDGFEDHLPPHLPVAEVWAAVQGTAPQMLYRFTLTAGGQFRYGNFDDSVTLFFGNAGQAGDAVTFVDWAVYRDYRLALEAGHQRSGHTVEIKPDLPVVFNVETAGVAPTDVRTGRWFHSTDTYSLPPVSSSIYQPGRRSAPVMVTLSKPAEIGHMVYERDDVYITDAGEGFMLEMFAQAQSVQRDGPSTGVGMEVDDGIVIRRLMFLDDGTDLRVGISRLNGSYAIPSLVVAHTSLKLYRLTYDRSLNLVYFDIDGARVMTYDPTADAESALPLSVARGRVRVGHITDAVTEAIFGLARLCWVNRYLAWESATPSPIQIGPGPAPAFVWEDGTSSTYTQGGFLPPGNVNGGVIVITKSVRNEIGSKGLFFTPYNFAEERGAFLEFRMDLKTYTNGAGTVMAKRADTGVSVTLHYSTTKLQLGFMDAGLNGRFVCILGKDVAVQDFLDQTDAGKARSVRVDWLETHTYRLHVTPTKIDLWIDSSVGAPALSIASVYGLNLPDDERVTPGLSFGHSSQISSSISEWFFVRFGGSTGYDVGIEQTDPDPSADKFDGRLSYQLSFGDGGN
jgi:hypothetical protein